jgi:hypothetical protein
VSFAGDANYGYPLLLQLMNTTAFFGLSRDRRLDLTRANGHAIRVFNQMLSMIHSLPIRVPEVEQPKTLFMIGGYSWRDASFRAWLIQYSAERNRFESHRLIWPREEAGRRWSVHFDGSTVAVADANQRLGRLLADRGLRRADGLDMEPLEVLRDVIRAGVDDTVAGPPQVAKTYRHLNTQFFAVPWEGELTVVGRPVLGYERAEIPQIDPDDPSRPAWRESGQPIGEEDEFDSVGETED